MKVAVFSTKSYDKRFLLEANERQDHEFVFFESRLNRETVSVAGGFPAVCIFVNDRLDSETIKQLSESGTRLIALRCAGFNNVDISAAENNGIQVVRVPAYSPHAVAEHTVALLLSANRKIHRAYSRVREGNFSLEGLLGFDLHGKTVGIIGTGKIGTIVAQLLNGFGCRLFAHDIHPNSVCEKIGVQYTSLEHLFDASDIITLHCPLTPDTHHLIDQKALDRMKKGIILINTSRGSIIDTRAVIAGLKSEKIGNLALDVYEEEADLFFEDLSNKVIRDDVFARLLTFPNVVITAHQGFFTEEALRNIAETTVENIREFEHHHTSENAVTSEMVTG
ncbi:MAG: 2-hydroxyacid dehydrogenase [Desulfobacterales bacterium]